MEVHFSPEFEAKLNRAAAEIRREPGDYAGQLVEQYLDHDLWFRQKVAASLERLDRGEYLSEDEASARLSKLTGA